MLEIIATASMLAKEKRFANHEEWITSARMYAEGNLEVAWNGKVGGVAVKACIDSSRWVAFCPSCGSAEAVDPEEKIFFCFRCNMFDYNYEALPVEFPDTKTIAEITACLIERPMIQKVDLLGMNELLEWFQ